MAAGRLVCTASSGLPHQGIRISQQFLHQPTATHMMQQGHKKQFWTSCELHAILVATGWAIPNQYDCSKENRESFQSGYVSVVFSYTDPCAEGITRQIKSRMKLQHYKPQEVWLVFQIPETLPIGGTVRRIYQIQREFYSKHKLHLESSFLDIEKQQGPEDVPWKWHPGSLFRDSHLSHSHRNQPHKDRYGSSGTHLHYSIWNFFFSLPVPRLYFLHCTGTHNHNRVSGHYCNTISQGFSGYNFNTK